jgi:hypothetical protein
MKKSTVNGPEALINEYVLYNRIHLIVTYLALNSLNLLNVQIESFKFFD